MVKRGDLLKVFFIYLCLCHVVPGHPCGHNPLARFRPLARMLNRDVNYLLDLLREANTPLYNQLRLEWRLYAECVGLVDTGYFKRSGRQGALAATGHQEQEEVEQAVSRDHRQGTAAATAAVPAVSAAAAGQVQHGKAEEGESRDRVQKNLRTLLQLLQRVLDAMGPTASSSDHSDVAAAFRDDGLTGMEK